MPNYRVRRSFGGFTRESVVELTKKDGDHLTEHGYVEATGTAAKKTPKRRAAKKTTPAAKAPAEAPPES